MSKTMALDDWSLGDLGEGLQGMTHFNSHPTKTFHIHSAFRGILGIHIRAAFGAERSKDENALRYVVHPMRRLHLSQDNTLRLTVES